MIQGLTLSNLPNQNFADLSHNGRLLGIFLAMIMLLVDASIFGGITAVFSGLASTPMIVAPAIADTVSAVIFVAFAVAIYRLSSDDTKELTGVFE